MLTEEGELKIMVKWYPILIAWALGLAACDKSPGITDRRPTERPSSIDAFYERQLIKAEEQAKRYDQLLDQIGEQNVRFDKILETWERQAARYDAILDKWDKAAEKRARLPD